MNVTYYTKSHAKAYVTCHTKSHLKRMLHAITTCQMKTKLLLTTYFLLTTLHLLAQGSLPIKKFSYREMGTQRAIWSFWQDRNGFMYVGSSGVLSQYDGKQWRKVKHETDSINPTIFVRKFYEDSTGRLYCFGDNTIGYLSTNAKSELIFKSLKDKLPKKYQNFTIGTTILPLKDGLYFCSVEGIFRWNGREFAVFPPPHTSFTRAYEAYGKIYARENGWGILTLTNDKFEYIKGSNFFAGERISMVRASTNGKILIASRGQGLYSYNPAETDSTKAFARLPTPIDEVMIKNGVYDSELLPDGTILLSLFTNGGVFQIDKEGKFLRWVYKTTDFVTTTYLDRTGQLWLGTGQNQVLRLNYYAPYTQFTPEDLDNQPLSWFTRFEGKIYAGGFAKLAVYKNGSFRSLANSSIQSLSFVQPTINGREMLLVGAFDGVVQIENEQVKPIYKGQPVSNMLLHPKFPNLIFVWDREGWQTIRYENGIWKFDQKLTAFKEQLSSLLPPLTNGSIFNYEKATNIVWARRRDGNIVAITWKDYTKPNEPTFETIEMPQKESNAGVQVIYKGQAIFATNTNYFTYNLKKKQFEVFELFKHYLLKSTDLQSVGGITNVGDSLFYFPINENNTDFQDFKRLDIAKVQANGTLAIDSTTHTYFPQMPANGGYFEGDTILWLAMNEVLLRYDLRKKLPQPKSFNVYVRQLKTPKEMVCGGVFCTNDSIANYRQHSNEVLTLNYKDNDLEFSFAAPYFLDEHNTQYSYFLQGFDHAEWSAWTTENKKEYTNLREGNYVFQVKAKNIFGQETEIATYQFTILPPIYRTWWAYCLYVLAAILLIVGLVYANSRRLLAAKKHLEEMVRQRTAEIEKQKAEIEAQRDNLVELNEEINQQREEILLTAENLKLANNEVSKKNEDIVASINYAQRIQAAMLPFEGRVTESIGKDNFFVLYKPKDIVSGDFYVFEQIDHKLFVAVADCTGHGVPGAFMSMIGNQLLHEIVVRDEIHRPDLVLNKLHIEIRRVLQQEQTGTQDGMDIALVVIDCKEGYFEYAGAMNPMYYVQGETQPTLQELKATKKPIGGRAFDHETERIFAYHTVYFNQQPTTLYLFSDGYCDQFGGTEKRKFMAKRFKETLLSVYAQPLETQKQHLDQTIKAWIQEGKEKQIDDILVMGVKMDYLLSK